MHTTVGPRGTIIAVGVATTLLTVAAAARAEVIEISGRNVRHITRFEPMEIGEGRLLISIEAVGVTIDPEGEITTNRMWGRLERVEGAGHDRGYFERAWPDGSITLERFDSEAAVGADGVAVFGRTFEYVGGTGRFAGVSGQGTFEGGRDYANGMIVVDWQPTMDVPAR